MRAASSGVQMRPVGDSRERPCAGKQVARLRLAPASVSAPNSASRKPPPSGGGFLLAEFGADTDAEAEAQARDLLSSASRLPGSPTGRICTPDEAARIWRIRESALGATVFVPGEPHGWEGWEDAAVAPEQLGSYLRQLWALMKEYDYRSPMYGHFGQG